MKYLSIPVILLFTVSLFGQNIDTTLNWDSFSGKDALKIDVPKGAEDLSLVFESEISTGSIEVSLIDPDGERQGGFQLNSSENDFVSVRSRSSGSNATEVIKDSNDTYINMRSGGNSLQINNNSFSLSTEDGVGINISSDGGVSIIEGSAPGENSGVAKGVMVENFGDPMSGKWQIKMKGENVSGTVNLKISFD